mmetsp:Transcript_8668/g.25747  ORF Transcript_8668/g.25747 Transcript_8668/m.25747 type:complete len:555 (+) Transcript_8668:86-1750(+)
MEVCAGQKPLQPRHLAPELGLCFRRHRIRLRRRGQRPWWQGRLLCLDRRGAEQSGDVRRGVVDDGGAGGTQLLRLGGRELQDRREHGQDCVGRGGVPGEQILEHHLLDVARHRRRLCKPQIAREPIGSRALPRGGRRLLLRLARGVACLLRQSRHLRVTARLRSRRRKQNLLVGGCAGRCGGRGGRGVGRRARERAWTGGAVQQVQSVGKGLQLVPLRTELFVLQILLLNEGASPRAHCRQLRSQAARVCAGSIGRLLERRVRMRARRCRRLLEAPPVIGEDGCRLCVPLRRRCLRRGVAPLLGGGEQTHLRPHRLSVRIKLCLRLRRLRLRRTQLAAQSRHFRAHPRSHLRRTRLAPRGRRQHRSGAVLNCRRRPRVATVVPAERAESVVRTAIGGRCARSYAGSGGWRGSPDCLAAESGCGGSGLLAPDALHHGGVLLEHRRLLALEGRLGRNVQSPHLLLSLCQLSSQPLNLFVQALDLGGSCYLPLCVRAAIGNFCQLPFLQSCRDSRGLAGRRALLCQSQLLLHRRDPALHSALGGRQLGAHRPERLAL